LCIVVGGDGHLKPCIVLSVFQRVDYGFGGEPVTASWRDCFLPSFVTGPVLSWVLRRLPSICRKQLILRPTPEVSSNYKGIDALPLPPGALVAAAM
jgi:hypothetical protein